MKRLIIVFTCFTTSLVATAQLAVTGDHLKMSDVIEYYKKYQQPYRNQDDPDAKTIGVGKFQEKPENKDYQFDRWRWYWQQHLDANGYLLSPVKTYNAWKAYEDAGSASRTTNTSGASWIFQGDDSSSGQNNDGVGRIAVIAFHPTVANTYWIGSAGGGAWKTTNNGATWTNMTNSMPLLSVSDLKFNPRNPNTVYLCSGDRDAQSYYSAGLFKTTNGGATWNTTGIAWNEYAFHQANSILVNPLDTNSLVFASDQGIYRSFNGGTTWTAPVVSGNFMQLLYHPTDTNIVYATSFVNYSTGASAQIYRSADGGMTWTQVTFLTDADRITLAITPSDVSIVKAIVSEFDATNQDGLEGIYSSSDTGRTYTEIFTPDPCSFGFGNLLGFHDDGSGCGGQGYYDLSLAIDPTNENNVFCGGINGWQSFDGGFTWQLMEDWDGGTPGVITLHADKHFMAFQPLVPGRFFETNDGGVFWSDAPSPMGIWNDVTNGMGITEFYRVAVSNAATYEIAGAQDEGTKYIQFMQSLQVGGGDGMECQMDPMDTTTFYLSSEYGNINLVNTLSGVTYISNNIPGTPSGAWVTPYIIEPTCHTCIVAGYSDVWRSTDAGTSWTDISGLLTGNNLLRVVTTLADSNTFYAAGSYSDSLFYTHNMGATPWNSIVAPYPGQNISDVIIDPRNPQQIWVAFSGYTSSGSPQVAEYNETTNRWTRFSTNLPDVPVNCIQMDVKNRTLYVGTDVGVFYRDSTMTEWEPFTTGMPVVRVNDLQINYSTNTIWAATYGRSLWSSAKHLAPSGVTKAQLASDDMKVHPNPNRGAFSVIVNNPMSGSAVDLTMTDNLGNIVWKASSTSQNATIQVNTSGLAKGIYILKASGPAGIIGTEKIVVD